MKRLLYRLNWKYVKRGLAGLVMVEVGGLLELGLQYDSINMMYLAFVEAVGMAILIALIEE